MNGEPAIDPTADLSSSPETLVAGLAQIAPVWLARAQTQLAVNRQRQTTLIVTD